MVKVLSGRIPGFLLGVLLSLCGLVRGQSGASVSERAVASLRWQSYSECALVRFTPGPCLLENDLSKFVEVRPALPNMRVCPSWDGEGMLIYGDWVAESTYEVRVKAGVRFREGPSLRHDGTLRMRVPRLDPLVRLVSKGTFYPLSRKELLLPLRLRNISTLEVSAYRIHAENLIPYDLSEYQFRQMTSKLGQKSYRVDLSDNESEEMDFDLSGVLPVGKPGMYMVSFEGRDAGKRWGEVSESTANTSREFLVVTDLGLAVCRDKAGRELAVSVRRLSDNVAVQGATVAVYSQKNLLIASGKSDQSGLYRLRFDSRFTEDNSPRIAMVSHGEDRSFIELAQHEYESDAWTQYGASDGSLPLTTGPQGFVYWERGAVRPGESARVSVFLRQRDERHLRVLGGFPCVLSLYGPTGRLVKRVKVKSDVYGHVSHSFEFGSSFATGGYRACCEIDGGKRLGSSSILLASYVPDRLKVELSVSSRVVHPGESLMGTCRARYYYGSPALSARGQMKVRSVGSYRPAHWRGYTVGGLLDDNASSVLTDGNHSFRRLGESQSLEYLVSPRLGSSLPWELRVSGTVLEEGGRGVTSGCQVIVDTCPWYLGVGECESAASGDLLVPYEALGLDPSRPPAVAAGTAVSAQAYAVTWDYAQIETADGYARNWVRLRQKVGPARQLTLSGARGRLCLPSLPRGHYEIELKLGDHWGTVADCWHYYGEGGVRSADPNVLIFSTDKSVYQPGDTAEIRFDAAGAGYGLLAHGESGLLGTETLAVKDGKNHFRVTIPSWLETGSYYCGVTVVTGTDPHNRLCGLVKLKVDQSAHRLKVALDAPRTVRPGEDMTIKVSFSAQDGSPVSGLAQVFLVDCGVLSLTDFKTPDIHRHFYGSRSCRLSFMDTYGLLYPELKLRGDRRIGGDGVFGHLRTKFGETELAKTAVVQAAPVIIGKDGQGACTVRLPKFLGAMRIMCVGSSSDRVGHGDREVIVRDHLGIQGSCPRAVVPGDEFECVYTLNNFSVADGAYRFAVSLPRSLQALGPVTFTGELKCGVPVVRRLRVRALESLGSVQFSSVLSMGKVSVEETLHCTVRSANPPVSVSKTVLIPGGGESRFGVSSQSWLVGTGSGALSVSGLPVSGLRDSLSWLSAYPYGCLEQSVASVFPLLNLDQLVSCGILTKAEAETHRHRQEAVNARIRSMYRGHGMFSLWPGLRLSHEDSTLFAANYLFELHRRQPQDLTLLRDLERDFLLPLVEDARRPSGIRGYGCYILSLLDSVGGTGDSAGTIAAMNMLAGGEVSFGTLLASAALIKSGHASEGMPMFRRCLEAEVWHEAGAPYFYGDASSRLGMVLYLLMDVLPKDPLGSKLAVALSQSVRNDGLGWGTTQANAWASLGLTSYVAFHQSGVSCSGVAVVGQGKPVALGKGGTGSWRLRESDSIVIRNTGKSGLFATFRCDGVPRGRLSNVSGALGIKRTYLNQAGQPVTSARQGELLQVRLDMEALCNVSDLVLVDLLPGGLEIEDSRLATRATAINSKGKGRMCPKFIENRDDRLVMFGDMTSDGRGSYTYQVRAVSRGRYQVPPVIVEAMYAPDLRAVCADQDVFEVK